MGDVGWKRAVSSLFIAAVGMIHVLQGVLVLVTADLPHPTPVTTMVGLAYSILGSDGYIVALFLIIAGSMALVHALMPGIMRYLALIPQQFALLCSSSGAILAIISGSYPDGYQTAALYIAEDQLHWPVLMIAHLVFMVRGR